MKYKFKDRVYDDASMLALIEDICRHNSCARKCPLDIDPNLSCAASTYAYAVIKGNGDEYIDRLKGTIINHLIHKKVIIEVE